MNALIQAFAIFVLPFVVFVIGVTIMRSLSDSHHVTRVLETLSPADQKSLNTRFGYSTNQVQRHWKPIVKDQQAFEAAQRSLDIDLIFPVFYGGALATSLLMAWASLGRPFGVYCIIVPVAIFMFADWTENLVQLAELRRFANETLKQEPNQPGEASRQDRPDPTLLDAGSIQVASNATIVKLAFIGGTVLFLAVLVACMVLRHVGACCN